LRHPTPPVKAYAVRERFFRIFRRCGNLAVVFSRYFFLWYDSFRAGHAIAVLFPVRECTITHFLEVSRDS